MHQEVGICVKLGWVLAGESLYRYAGYVLVCVLVCVCAAWQADDMELKLSRSSK